MNGLACHELDFAVRFRLNGGLSITGLVMVWANNLYELMVVLS